MPLRRSTTVRAESVQTLRYRTDPASSSVIILQMRRLETESQLHVTSLATCLLRCSIATNGRRDVESLCRSRLPAHFRQVGTGTASKSCRQSPRLPAARIRTKVQRPEARGTKNSPGTPAISLFETSLGVSRNRSLAGNERPAWGTFVVQSDGSNLEARAYKLALTARTCRLRPRPYLCLPHARQRGFGAAGGVAMPWQRCSGRPRPSALSWPLLGSP